MIFGKIYNSTGTVFNTGFIIGDVHLLSTGAFDGRGGTLTGQVVGSSSNNSYWIDDANTVIVEGASGGSDSVYIDGSYTLGANLENLFLLGTDNHTGTGNSAANQLDGNDGNNALFGLAGADTLNGGLGNDTLNGGAGADELNGDDGDDWASYQGSSAAVTVNLETGAASGGDAAGDTFSSIERLIGSDHADDLTGDATKNVIRGGAGADTLDGGDGRDILNYIGSASAVTVNLGTGAASGGDAEGDVFSNFENLKGSVHDDHLTGDAGRNLIIGGKGDDTIDGGGGNDRLLGKDGDDMFLFSAGNDEIDGGDGDDEAQFGGDIADFTVVATADGNWTVTEIATGDVDTLTSIEALVFDNGTLTPSDYGF